MFATKLKAARESLGFTQAEMASAAQTLRDAVKRADAPPPPPDEDERDETGKKKEPVVAMSQRAWPMIDMLERTSKGGPKANIVWEASADF